MRGLTVSLILCLCIGALLLVAAPARATIFGTVRGIVHDPQHRPIPGAIVTLKAANSDYSQSKATDQDGAFAFSAVPLGNYTLSVAITGFEPLAQSLSVGSEQAIDLHLQLAVSGVSQSVVVSGGPSEEVSPSVTPTTTVDRAQIQNTPGADRTDSMAAITDNVPGSYVVHDMLHIRGGHQFSWMIDGVPVPNTNIADNVGPQLDPKDLDYIEVQRGSYDAEYGDRTYGVFNAVPRSGFERDKQCELSLSYGNFNQSNDQVNCGGHSEKFAYYGSFDGNETGLGLQTPTAQVLNDGAFGYGGFGSFIYNVDSANQLRWVTSLRQDIFSIPNPPTLDIGQPFPYSPETVVVTPFPGAFQDDTQRETDGLVNFSWVHSFSHQGLMTLSPFYHFNAANYDSSPIDFPNAVTNHRASSYLGGQMTLGATLARNTIEGGFYGFWQRDDQLFGVLFNDGFGPPLADRELLSGSSFATFIQDKYAPTTWLTINGGVRLTHFGSAALNEEVASPRAGASVRLPKINWVFRAFYGQFYQPPPLETLSGSVLGLASGSGQQFVPLHGERDTERQLGLAIPFKGWTVDIDTFRTFSRNFLDHGNVNYLFDGMTLPTNLYVPLTTQFALVRAWELTLRSPQLWHRAQVHLAYSNQVAEFMGTTTGGLNDFSVQEGWAPLDHDQRNTLSIGYDLRLPWKANFGGNITYGSGFANGAAENFDGLTPPPPQYLAGHTTVDFTLSKAVRENLSLSVNALNVFNSHLLIDDSLTFGGFHYNNPREIYAQLRYSFHY